jgi:DUF1680 family protein
LNFKPELWEANPLVEETVNHVAVKYGPLVYCVESNDLPEGVRLREVVVQSGVEPVFSFRQEQLADTRVGTLTLPALALPSQPWSDQELYRPATRQTPRPFSLKVVPYYAWGNRGDTEMSVWLPAR